MGKNGSADSGSSRPPGPNLFADFGLTAATRHRAPDAPGGAAVRERGAPAGAAAAGHDFDRFLRALAARRDYAGQIAHVERLAPRPARYAEPAEPLPETLRAALRSLAVEKLYLHQARAMDLGRAGRSFVVVSGTASGKTLCYNLPVIERLLGESEAHAFYLFPTKALAQDQLKSLSRLGESAPEIRERVRAGTYDGDTTPHARRKLRDEGNLILTNPDMLHQGILPSHVRWARFFSSLRFVVVDEIHTYRGIFGSHVAQVLRRLRRIARHYGADPVFIASSATIRNPAELARALFGMEDVDLIDEDGSPRGPKHFVFWNPPYLDPARMERKSSNVEGQELLTALVKEDIQAIVFTRARVTAELVYRYAREALLRENKDLADSLSPYRGGYLPQERREIERRLFSGELKGVVSTNVGSLDASILIGFPTTIASTWQQAGRAGRGPHPALAELVAYNDPIDQYLMRHPAFFFQASPEAAVIDPENPHILASHLACAAYELPLSDRDREWFGPLAPEVAAILEDEGQLKELDGSFYWSNTEFPAARTPLRTISDDTFTIVDAEKDNQPVLRLNHP